MDVTIHHNTGTNNVIAMSKPDGQMLLLIDTPEQSYEYMAGADSVVKVPLKIDCGYDTYKEEPVCECPIIEKPAPIIVNMSSPTVFAIGIITGILIGYILTRLFRG